MSLNSLSAFSSASVIFGVKSSSVHRFLRSRTSKSPAAAIKFSIPARKTFKCLNSERTRSSSAFSSDLRSVSVLTLSSSLSIHSMVERYAVRVAEIMPSVAMKRVSPHTIRHTTATHLLRAGVDINTIRAWLGNVSLVTTNVYAEVDLEMKAKALARCEVGREDQAHKPWREDEGLMDFLRTL
jgi:hypothetical protein